MKGEERFRMETQIDERYRVIVQHVSKGVLHQGSFKTLSQARNFLEDQWAKLPEPGLLLSALYGAAIFDRYAHRLVSVLGDSQLFDEQPPM